MVEEAGVVIPPLRETIMVDHIAKKNNKEPAGEGMGKKRD